MIAAANLCKSCFCDDSSDRIIESDSLSLAGRADARCGGEAQECYGMLEWHHDRSTAKMQCVA